MALRLASVIALLFVSSLGFASNAATSDVEHYIVYLGPHLHPDSETVIRANEKILSSVIESLDEARASMVYHYSKSFQGFSAMLRPEQALRLSKKGEVISVFESRMNQLHTTHSWDFLALPFPPIPPDEASGSSSMSDVIVGVIDTGIWPESLSFDDTGLGPVPKRFKGECVPGDNFTSAHCNRKIIGAKYYYKGLEADIGPFESINEKYFRSARDSDGHGSHTSSTIAGSLVNNVNVFEMGRGTARGGAPSARLAMYKTCWFGGLCSDADILAAMDDAISDGVDIISSSLGPAPPEPSFFLNAISIGAFHAFHKGILVSASAGNFFFPGTATNGAPWMLTVAASTVDREFTTNITLGNSKIIKGYALNPFTMETSYGLIEGSAAAAPGVTRENARLCRRNTLDPTLVKGKIVVCHLGTLLSDSRLARADAIKAAGGVGMILLDPVAKDVLFQLPIPSSLVTPLEAVELEEYLATESNPTAQIIPTETVLQTQPAPSMAMFSSMGPNTVTPEIIKPDVTAPGVNILAAWSPVATILGKSFDYNIQSGTSMSCPHVSAIAALLKSIHPSWGPAAIKSAIMTTATPTNNVKELIGKNPNGTETTPFDYGSGQVNPVATMDPGLIYDFDSTDVISFLCSLGAGPAEFKNLTGDLLYCPKTKTPSYNLNYPSIGVAKMRGSLSVHRTVTYYGEGPTVYSSYVESPAGVSLTVNPTKLKFSKPGEKLSYRIDFTPYKSINGSFVFGSLTWSNGMQSVRSPIGLNVVSVSN